MLLYDVRYVVWLLFGSKLQPNIEFTLRRVLAFLDFRPP